SMGTDLRHQENAVPTTLQGAPHPFLAAVVVVLPRVVQKGDAGIHRLLNQPHGILDRWHGPEMVSAQSEDRDPFARPSEGPAGNLISARARHFRRTGRGSGGAGEN